MASSTAHFPLEFAIVGWLVFAAVAARALWVVRTEFLPLSIQQHAWLAGIVALGALWSLRISLGSEVRLGLIGMPLYALLFGPHRALLGGAIALAGLTLLTDRSWQDLGLTGLALVALPAWSTHLLQRLIAKLLPRHLFVFIIGNGLFITAFAAAITSAAQLVPAFATPSAAASVDTGDLIGYALLLAWGEALASGMIFSALVVFRPQLVMTYAQDDYLPRRPRL